MKLIIPGKLPGMNEYISAERTNRYEAAAMKREAEKLVILAARSSLRGWKAKGPVMMHYLWVEKDRKRDKDNISGYGRKIIQDSLVKAKFLRNDGWNDIVGFTDSFGVDKGNPHIEVIIEEISEWEK